MKAVRYLMLIGACIAGSAYAEDTGSIAIFTTANEAYDRGDYAEALGHYRELTRRQPASAEAWYNAANAAFRGGSAGEAVLYYRRAWYLNPRDPDVLANMQLALQRTGALSTPQTMLQRATQEFSQREWALIFKISYWIAIVAAAGTIWFPAARRFGRPVLAVSIATGLIALGGWWHWRSWKASPEVVMIEGRQTALYEPRAAATPFFAVPEGSILTREDRFDQWIKVRASGKSGWIPAASARQVIAWNTADF